jgi:trans-2,3-dihydro-3-hydroxyanthranilate isomerase
LQSEPACNVFVLTCETDMPDAQIHARMFAPALGVTEDPATGAAAAALAGLLEAAFPRGPCRWLIEQGVEMKRPSRIALKYQRGDKGLHAVTVDGPLVRVAEGVLDI